MGKVITYECDQCGCEVVVSETPDTEMGPIYCCGDEVKMVSAQEKTAQPKKKAAAKKAPKKAVKKAPKKAVKKTVKKGAKKK